MDPEIVLLVEDKEEIRNILRSILEKQNFVVHSAVDGQAALDFLLENKVDLVISDIMMPNLNGIDLMARSMAEGILVPFVFITAFADAEIAGKALQLGALDFINKPFVFDEVIDVLHRVLETVKNRNKMMNEVELISKEATKIMRKYDRLNAILRIKNFQSRDKSAPHID